MRHNAVMQKPKIEVPPQDRLNLTRRSFGLGLGNTLRKPVDPGREETEKKFVTNMEEPQLFEPGCDGSCNRRPECSDWVRGDLNQEKKKRDKSLHEKFKPRKQRDWLLLLLQ